MKFKIYAPFLVMLFASLGLRAQIFTTLTLNTATLVSGTPLQPGAVYRYSNAAGGSGNLIDAYIQVVKTSNTGTNYVGLFAFDNLASVNNPGGYDYAFQPVTSCSNVNTNGLWTASGSCSQGDVKISATASQNYLVHFRLYFKKAGTQTDTALNVHTAFIDIDGFGGSTTEAEQNAFMPGIGYALASPTTISVTLRPDGLYNAEGQSANVGGIQLTTATAISQVAYLYRTFIDFGIGMNTHSGSAYGGCYDGVAGGRLASVSFSNQPGGIPIVTPTIVTLNGTVWGDADGSANGTFSNIKTGAEVGTNGEGLFVYALDSTSGTVVGKSVVNANGTWSIDSLPKGMPVKLLLSNVNVAEGVTNGAPTTGSLNSGWVAESPLVRPAFRPNANTANLDFGIEHVPAGANATTAHQLNPGGVIRVPVPSSALTGTDPEDGSYPAGLLGKKVTITPGSNGNFYYNGSLITVPTTTTGFNPDLLTIDPTGPNPTGYAAVTSTFNYSVYDAAGQPSAAKTITMPFDPSLCLTNVRVYLEGSLMNNANAVAPDGRPLMRDNLRNSPFSPVGANYIPVKDPYEFATAHVNVIAKYTKMAPQDASHPQFQQVTDSATVFGVTGQNAIVDWVFVELRNKANNATVLATRAGLLQRDGDIVDVDGAGCLSFPGVAPDSFYVAVRHRDHLGAMTRYGQSSTNLQTLVDMTLATTPMFDFGASLGNGFDYTGLATNNGVKTGYRALWAGDFNADKKVKYDNPGGDDNTLFFDVITDPGNSAGLTNYNASIGYWQGDYNMDSKDKYDNPAGDDNALFFLLANYPLNTAHLTNFNFFIQQIP